MESEGRFLVKAGEERTEDDDAEVPAGGRPGMIVRGKGEDAEAAEDGSAGIR